MMQIVWLFTTDFAKLVSIAIISALPLAWWVKEMWMQHFAYKAGITWGLFVACAVAIMITSVIPVILQSIKASLKNPANILATD